MKRFIFSFLILFSLNAFSQNGITIHYEQLRYEDGSWEPFGPGFLVFYKDSIEYGMMKVKKIPKEVGNKFQLHGHYVDYRSRTMINQSHPMDLPKYKIIDTSYEYNWTLINEEKIVLGKRCLKAVTELHGQMVTAWYDTTLKYPTGPSLLNGLPGLILEANYQRPIMSVTAVSVTPGTPVINKPEDGKEISYEAFQAAIRERNEKSKSRETIIRVH